MPKNPVPLDLAPILAAAARLQGILKGAVLVGGSAAARHAGHRISLDADHVLNDLSDRFDQILEALEATDGWATARVHRPVMILGNLDGIETGIRQLVRRRPLEVEEVRIGGKKLTILTLEEITRVKAWLIIRRNATRDYIDFVALADRIGPGAAAVGMGLDEYYEDQMGHGGRRVATQFAQQLADPSPYDLSEVDLPRYRKLIPRWRDWSRVTAACRGVAGAMLDLLSREE